VIDPEMLKRLEALGLKPEDARWVETQPVDINELPTIQKNRELLMKLRELLQTELAESRSKLEAALEQRERMKNGGGA
jgi:hypothetical protein